MRFRFDGGTIVLDGEDAERDGPRGWSSFRPQRGARVVRYRRRVDVDAVLEILAT